MKGSAVVDSPEIHEQSQEFHFRGVQQLQTVEDSSHLEGRIISVLAAGGLEPLDIKVEHEDSTRITRIEFLPETLTTDAGRIYLGFSQPGTTTEIRGVRVLIPTSGGKALITFPF